MKVLLLSPFYAPGVGGSSRLMADIVEHLVRRGHDVDVLTFGLDAPEVYAAFDASRSYHIARVRSKRLKGGASLVMFFRLLLMAARRRYDVILCGAAYPTAVLAYAACMLTRGAYAVYSHGEDVTEVRGSRVKTALLARALRRAQAVMTNSTFTQRQVRALQVDGPRLRWVPPGIDPLPYEQVSAEAVEALRARLGLAGKRVVLTLARLTARKGHDTIVQALARLIGEFPDVQYLIVGMGDQMALRSIAETHHVSANVTFVPYVPDADLPALFNLCEVHAMVSRWDPATKQVEGFGIVYLEAAAAGKPSVAAVEGGAPDAVEDGKTGILVDPASVDAVSAALRRLLSDPDGAAAMGRAGREKVRRQFTKERCLQMVEDCLMWSRRGINPETAPGAPPLSAGSRAG